MESRNVIRTIGAAILVATAGCQLLIGIEDVVLQDAGSCSINDTRDVTETGVDCGGAACPPCAAGQGCEVGPDCQSKICTGGTCAAPSCTDEVQNGDETDIDCGSTCPACGPEATCTTPTDCASGICEEGACVSTCTDDLLGGTETAVDCGGTACPGCNNGDDCATGGDCESGVCTGALCTDYHIWSKRLGGAGTERPTDIALDTTGSLVLTGNFEGSAEFGGAQLTSAGKDDIVIARFDGGGMHTWSKRFGDAEMDEAAAVTIDATSNIIVTGSFEGAPNFGGGPLASAGSRDIFLVKFDLAGGHQWSRRFGDNQPQYASGVAVDGSSNIVVVGFFAGSVNFGGNPLISAGQFDIFVVKLSAASGNHLWSRRFGDDKQQVAESVVVDGASNVIMVGSFFGVVDFGGGPIATINPLDVDAYVTKLDASGAYLWSTRFGGASAQRATSVAVDGSGNVVVAGQFSGSVDFGGGVLTSADQNDIFVVKLDSSGLHQWSHRFGGSNNQRDPQIAIDPSGSILLVATGFGTIDFGGDPLPSAGDEDVFIAKLDPDGNHLWSRSFGGPLVDGVTTVATVDSEGVVIAGQFTNAIDLGGGVLESAGERDVFLAKLRTQSIQP